MLRWLAHLILTLLIFLFFPAAMTQALSPPSLPAAYFGTVMLNGSPAPEGTVIRARIAGEVRGEIRVTEAGKYGGPGPLDPKLIVQGSIEEEGKQVTFEVAGNQAEQTLEFRPGDVRQVNLTATGALPPSSGGTPAAAPGTSAPSGGGVPSVPSAGSSPSEAAVPQSTMPGVVQVPVRPGAVTVAEVPGAVRIEVLASAVSGEGAVITAKVLPDSEAMPLVARAEGITAAGPVVEVTIEGGQFTGPAEVELFYDPGKVAPDKVPAAYFYSERKEKWVFLGGSHDPQAGVVRLEVTHLTKFAVFARKPPQKFTDLSGHWAESTLCRLVGMEVVSGYPDGTFKPEKELTRAEFVAMITKVLYPRPVRAESIRFRDQEQIPPWAGEAVNTAAAEGLVRGYPQPDGGFSFQANKPITRLEMAAILERILQKEKLLTGLAPTTSVDLNFADAHQIPDWGRSAVATMAARKIVVGFPDHTFRPQSNITRAEAGVMLLRLLDLIYS